MMSLSPRRRGELFILTGTLLWSLFPVVTILTFSRLSTFMAAGLATLVSAAFFAVLLTMKGRWSDFLKKAAWKGMLLTTLYIGIVYYGLVFIGIKFTTAGNASIMSQMELFFAFLLLSVVLKHERISTQQVIGSVSMVLGAVLILLPKASGWHIGDAIIVFATMFPPIGNKHAQSARALVSSEAIMFCRSFFSGIFLLLLGGIIEPLPSIAALSASVPMLLLNGILLLGYSKILWIEGINLIPITEATSICSINPLFTLLFAFLLLHEHVTSVQILGFIPIAVGMLLLIRKEGIVVTVNP